MPKTQQDYQRPNGDEVLRRLLKTPPQPKVAESKEKAKAKPKKKKPTK